MCRTGGLKRCSACSTSPSSNQFCLPPAWVNEFFPTRCSACGRLSQTALSERDTVTGSSNAGADALAGHVILTGPDGVLRGTTADAVNEIVDAAAASAGVVLHFHGGLVSEQRGLATAAGLLPVPRQAGADPAVSVW